MHLQLWVAKGGGPQPSLPSVPPAQRGWAAYGPVSWALPWLLMGCISHHPTVASSAIGPQELSPSVVFRSARPKLLEQFCICMSEPFKSLPPLCMSAACVFLLCWILVRIHGTLIQKYPCQGCSLQKTVWVLRRTWRVFRFWETRERT